MRSSLRPGQIVWVNLSPTSGKEQAGHRPAVVISGPTYLEVVTDLAVVVPVTRTGQGWENHVKLAALESWAMTEQVRTIARSRITRISGTVTPEELRSIRRWVIDLIDEPPTR